MEYRKAVLSDVDTLSRMRAAMLSEEEKYTDAFQALIYENTKKYMVLLNTTDMGKPLYDKFGFASSPTAMALHSF